MKNVLLAAALVSTLIGQAHAQQTRVSPFHNGMGFSYGPDGSHDTYVFRNGALTDQHFGNPTNPDTTPQPMIIPPLLDDNN